MKKILLIEDDRILVQMYKDKFKKAGFNMLVAFDAKQGLKMTKKEKPDLILLDILLPGEDGISFLAKLRKNPKISSTPVLAFSNYDTVQIKKLALRLGVLDYLIKANYTPKQLLEKVNSCLK